MGEAVDGRREIDGFGMYNFAEIRVWPTDALHRELGGLAAFFNDVPHHSERADDKLREALHISFELEQRGEPWLPANLPPAPLITPKKRKR